MKILAMYLPQFYRTPENDEWWGEGFTDWVSTKKAIPLYDGHYQPHVPLRENYYDLTEKNTMEWQADLMQQYGIDGMCFYHYWFKDGRRVLEKPAENLLQWKDVAMPFCFCWANEAWGRSWSKYRNVNAWVNETQIVDELSKQDTGILLEQNYGTEKQWKEHFDYLLPFFLDERYILMEGKPLVVIYKAYDIPCLKDMLEYWKKLALDAGLKGIYTIGVHCNWVSRASVDAELFHEPVYSRRSIANYGKPEIIDYEMFWKQVMKAKGIGKTYYGGFVGYDDTPRRAGDGMVIQGANPIIFEKYLTQLIEKNQACGNELLFLNAWNEWGEGMHLEPDEKFGCGFLEAVRSAKESVKDKMITLDIETDNEYQMWLQSRADKFESYLNLLDAWMTLREDGVSLAERLQNLGIGKIGIYGWGIFGRHLARELENTSIEIVAIIDRNKNMIRPEYLSFFPEDALPEMDALIVTAYFFYDEIKTIYKDVELKLISVESLIKEEHYE